MPKQPISIKNFVHCGALQSGRTILSGDSREIVKSIMEGIIYNRKLSGSTKRMHNKGLVEGVVVANTLGICSFLKKIIA